MSKYITIDKYEGLEPKYRPYTTEDIDELEPSKRYIKNDITKERMAILTWDHEDISIFIPERNSVTNISYEDMLNHSKHLDGSKCGIKK